jgi:hypothetical protein
MGTVAYRHVITAIWETGEGGLWVHVQSRQHLKLFLKKKQKQKQKTPLPYYVTLQLLDQINLTNDALRKTPLFYAYKEKQSDKQINTEILLIFKSHDFLFLCPHPHTLITTNHDVNSSGKV